MLQESVCSFMKFPRGYILESISFNDIDSPVNFWEREINLLEKLVSISSDVNVERGVCSKPIKICIFFTYHFYSAVKFVLLFFFKYCRYLICHVFIALGEFNNLMCMIMIIGVCLATQNCSSFEYSCSCCPLCG